MKLKRVLDTNGQLLRLDPDDAWSSRLRALVTDIMASDESGAYDGEIDIDDDLLQLPGIERHPVKEIAAAGGRIVTLDFEIRAAENDSAESPTLVFRATDESEDRHGSIIRFGGWDWSWYMRTGEGVFLYCHDYEFPSIGKTTNISKLLALKAHDFTVEYAIDAWDVPNMPNVSMLCYKLAKKNFMPQVSVGFIPKNAKPYTPKTLGIFGTQGDGIEFLEQEGLELSQVTVGSNRNAYGVKHAIRKGVVSENEVTASGLGRLLFNSRDVIDVSTLPKAISELRDPARRAAAVSQLPPAAFMRATAEDPAVVDPKKPGKKPKKPADDVATAEKKSMFGQVDASLPESQREIASMKALLQHDYSALDILLQAFRDAQHDGFRTTCACAMGDTMRRIADLLYWMEWWYSIQQDLGEFVVISTEVSTTIEDALGPVEARSAIGEQISKSFAPLAELRAIDIEPLGRRSFKVTSPNVTAKGVREIVHRVGKVLSKGNFDKLVQSMALIEEVLIAAGYDPTDIEDAEDALEAKGIDIGVAADFESIVRGFQARNVDDLDPHLTSLLAAFEPPA